MTFEKAELKGALPGMVIGKEIIGRSFRGVLNYVSDSANDHKKTGSERPFLTNMVGKNPRDLASEFGWMRALKTGMERAVSHYIISPGNGLSDAQLRTVIETGLQEMGYENCQFAAYIHRGKDKGGDDEHEHIHIIVNRIHMDTETCMPAVVSDSKNYERVNKASRAIERALGYEVQEQKEGEKKGPAKDRAAFNADNRSRRLQNQSEPKEEIMNDNVWPIRPIITTAKRREIIARLAEQATDDAANAEQWKTTLEKTLRDELGEELDMVFSHRRKDDPNSEIIGYSFYSPADGGFLKASNVSREISWTHIQRTLAVNLDERRRRSARINRAAAAAEMEASADLARETQRSPVPALGAIAPHFSRIQPRADAPAHTHAQAAPGVQLPGFVCALHTAGMNAWHYTSADAPEGPASLIDLPEAGAVLLTQAGLDSDPRAAIRAWLLLAAARHGKLLDVQGQVLDDPALRQIVIDEAAQIEGLSLHPLAAAVSEARRAMAPAPVEVSTPGGVDTLDFLNTPAAARAAPATGSPSASPDALPAPSAGPADELAQRLRRAIEICKLDTDAHRPALPGADASAADVRTSLAAFESLRAELDDYITTTRAIHAAENRPGLRDGSAAGRTAADRVMLSALAAATRAGEPHEIERARERVRAAQDAVAVARYERDQQGPVAALAEKLSGKKAAEIAELEEVERREREALAKAKAAFLSQPEVVQKVGQLQQTLDVQNHELSALHVAGGLLRLLQLLIDKLAGMVGLVDKKERDERDRQAARDRYAHRARGLAEGRQDALDDQAADDAEQEQRSTLRRGQK